MFFVSSSGRQDFMSHSLSMTKGNFPQGVKLDICKCTEALLQQWPLYYTLWTTDEQKYTWKPMLATIPVVGDQ